MALQKQVELDNGVTLNYHRITTLNKITNMNNIIEVSSYTNEKQRDIEKEYQALQQKAANLKETEMLTQEEQDKLNKGINVYISTEYFNLPYDESQSITEAYEYLKTTEKYKNAKDI